MPACQSCGAGFFWGSARGTGAFIPCDPPEVPVHEVDAKTVAVRRRDRLAVVLNAEQAANVRATPAEWSEWSFHGSHWESCPSSERHRVNPAQGALEL